MAGSTIYLAIARNMVDAMSWGKNPRRMSSLNEPTRRKRFGVNGWKNVPRTQTLHLEEKCATLQYRRMKFGTRLLVAVSDDDGRFMKKVRYRDAPGLS
ncbi:hypothetical protein PIB30_031289 [Stylosanthes scabra]|uniref:Uncharacterized protein n=1 Tax=Stylosanthes scabra TaxID=79078 RepID=A0ABU6Z9M1_9FABA|nr:hypothetical protein [Stylosanthes scabra]